MQHVIAIGLGVSQEDCFHRCCTLGPNDCQYLWIFEDKCFAVSCDRSSRTCEPMPLGRTSRPVTTTYVRMRFSSVVTPATHDQPPIANAGPGQVIQSPQNEVYLYGNNSRDDTVRIPCIALFLSSFLPPISISFSESLPPLFPLLPSSLSLSLCLIGMMKTV